MSRRARTISSRSFPWDNVDPDRRNAILLIGGIALVVVFSLLLAAYGYYTDRIKPQRETVLTVGNRDVDYATFERRVVADFRDGKIKGDEVEQGIAQTLGSIEREEMLKQTARLHGIEITEDDIFNEIRRLASIPSEASREAAAPLLRAELQQSGLKLSDIRAMATAAAAESKLKDKLETSLPAEAEQAFVRLIQTASQSQAIQAKQALERGETWAVVTGQYTNHSSKDTGGDLGFVPRGALPPEVEEFVFSKMGRSDIIETRNAFYLVEVVARETQVVGGQARELVGNAGLGRQLEETRDAIGSDPKLNSGHVQRVVRHLVEITSGG